MFEELLEENKEFNIESVNNILDTLFTNTTGNSYLYDISYENNVLVFIQINGKDVNIAKIGKDQQIKSFDTTTLIQFAFEEVLKEH